MTDKKKTTKKQEQLPEQQLLPFNPLLGNSNNHIITSEEETKHKVEMINEIETLAAINKQRLAAKRQQMELIIDNKKLDTAEKTADSIERIIESVSRADVLERVAEKIETPYDMNQMTQAAERLAKTLNMLMRPDVMDEFGNKRHFNINFAFRSTGPVEGAVQIKSSDK